MVYYFSKNFRHDDLESQKIKDETFRVFTQEDFDNYIEQIEEEDDKKEVKVIKNTTLHEINPDKMEDDKDYLIIGKLCFTLKDEKDCKAKFYIPIDELTFIRVEKKAIIIPFIILLLVLGALIGGSIFWLRGCNSDEPGDDPIDPLAMDASQKEGEGDQMRTPDSDFYQESTVVPGYAEVEATSKAALIPLSNPEENTVNFVYTILVNENSEVVKSFDDAAEAAAYAKENTKQYSNVREGDAYKLEDQDGNRTTEFIEYKTEANGNKTDVIKNTYKLLYFSDGIAPGNHIDWNCYEYLGVGTFDLQFRISTYDVNTSSQCYGAIQPVHVVITK